MKPEAATQQFAVTGYTRQIDVEQGRQRVEQTRTPKFAYFQGPQPQTQIQVTRRRRRLQRQRQRHAGAARAGRLRRDRRTELLPSSGDGAARGHRPSKPRSPTSATVGNVRQADFAFRDSQWTMTIDAAGLPLSISSRTVHPNLGDVVMTTTFADYQDVSGLKLPAQDRRQGRRLHDLRDSRRRNRRSTGRSAISPRRPRSSSPSRRRRRTSPPSRSAKACGSSPASRITACSSSSPIT